MVALALFYQTQAIHLLFFCNRGSVPTVFLISHPTSCSRFFTLCHVVRDEAKLFGSRNYMALLARSNNDIPQFSYFETPCPSAFAAFATIYFFFYEPTLVIGAPRIELARIARSLAACVSRRKSLVPSQISERFSARSPSSSISKLPRYFGHRLSVFSQSSGGKRRFIANPYFIWYQELRSGTRIGTQLGGLLPSFSCNTASTDFL